MGGPGSRIWYRWDTDHGKRKTSSLYPLDIRICQRRNWLTPGRRCNLTWSNNGEVTGSIGMHVLSADTAELHYRVREQRGSWKEEWQDVLQVVSITWTTCNFGGQRPWWQCPGCARRVAILYGSRRYLCRHCHNLTYRSQCEGWGDRAARKALKMRDRLGADDDLSWPVMTKPKGMHWKTYERLCRKEAQAHEEWNRYFSLQLGCIVGRGLDKDMFD